MIPTLLEIGISDEVAIAMVTSFGSLIAATIAAIVSVVNTRITSANTKHIGEVKEQVQNSHGTNLRNDIDSIIRSNTTIHDRLNIITELMNDREEDHKHEHRRMWNYISSVKRRNRQ